MKRTIFAVSSAAAILLTGCGDSSKQAPTPTQTTSTTPAAPTTPAVPGEKPVAGAEIKQAATTVAKEAVTEVKAQAQEAFSNLGQQLIDATKGGSSDTLLKNVSTDLQARVGKLAQSLAANDTVKQQLNTCVQALLGNKDLDAIAALNKLTAAKLTPEQTAMAKDVYNAAAALVTQRNFSSIEGMNSDVAQLVNSVWKGNYTQALTPLQKLYNQSTLTAAQKDLLGATFDKYMPAGWKDAAKTVQEGVNTLKRIGL